MHVRVSFLFSEALLPKDLENFKQAAQEFTNDLNSIQVNTQEKAEGFTVLTDFTMKTAAQYKVVDDIAKEFKFWTVNIEGYQSMSIQFPSN